MIIKSNNHWFRESVIEFEGMRSVYRGRTFLILGNGPSLDSVTAEHLRECVTIACNNAWRMRSKWSRDAEILLITDPARLEEFQSENVAVESRLVVGDCNQEIPSVSRWAYYVNRRALCVRQLLLPFFRRNPWATIPFKMNPRLFSLILDKRFCAFNIEEGFNFGHSVVVPGVQLAVALGASRILLAGIDANSGSASYFKLMPNNLKTDSGFLKNPRIMMEPYLALLRAYLDALSIPIFDCSHNGAIRSIERKELDLAVKDDNAT